VRADLPQNKRPGDDQGASSVLEPHRPDSAFSSWRDPELEEGAKSSRATEMKCQITRVFTGFIWQNASCEKIGRIWNGNPANLSAGIYEAYINPESRLDGTTRFRTQERVSRARLLLLSSRVIVFNVCVTWFYVIPPVVEKLDFLRNRNTITKNQCTKTTKRIKDRDNFLPFFFFQNWISLFNAHGGAQRGIFARILSERVWQQNGKN